MEKVFIPLALRAVDPTAWFRLSNGTPTQRQVNYWLRKNGLGRHVPKLRDSRHEAARKRDDSRNAMDTGEWTLRNASGPTDYHSQSVRNAQIMRNPKYQ